MDGWQGFFGPNAGYVAELYERYQRDSAAVDEATRAFFSHWQPPTVSPAPTVAGAPADLDKAVAVANLAGAIRAFGHLDSHLDPLGTPPHGDPALRPENHGLSEADLAALPAELVGGPAAAGAANAAEAITRLRRLYCGSSGYEYDHVHGDAERSWLRDAVESGRYAQPLAPDEAKRLLERLTEVEGFERYLQRTFPGQTRFSLEGLDMLVPMLDSIVADAARADVCEVMLAMAHRGRLNVLAHVLGKPYSLILAEFEGAVRNKGVAPAQGGLGGWTGDVKYHLGGTMPYREGEYVTIVATMAPNPSHLEAINPVAEGMARASDEGTDQAGPPEFYPNAALPVVIHGDAAFSAQGVVAETLALSGLAGYQTAGTIHIIANNQLGFTATSEEGRFTLYASDLAKGFEIPIVHVNADDPEACLAAARLTSAYRQQFHRDFLIDLVGYRRYGHNEGDDPTFTQPLLYARVAAQPSVRQQWEQRLAGAGLVSQAEAEKIAQQVSDRLRQAREAAGQVEDGSPGKPQTHGQRENRGTAVPESDLRRLNEELCRLPAGFTTNPRLARTLQRRCSALETGGRIDWGQAETLAFASLLAQGVAIRLSGQDTVRGTFSQRQLAVFDQRTGEEYVPLQQLPSARASFAAYNSPLSESAALGFEYGYSVHSKGVLVLWEAQYGDFANGAQVVIDQFVASGRAKWQEESALVLLLPHGFEGQGPEHSSARLERFLELAAEDNLRIANPSTAGQYFHLLRWQAGLMDSDPRPLVVMTPKSLLRLPEAAASLSDLTSGHFRPVLDDPQAGARAQRVNRLLLCSGKVYFDLLAGKARGRGEQVALARLELLYPFPAEELARLLGRYSNLTEIVWVQEEPENMGAWRFVATRLRRLLPQGTDLHYVGRPRRASPAEGSTSWHLAEQTRIVETALGSEAEPREMLRGAGHAG